jgi:Domain of unknown function (DUF4105)
VARVSTHTVAVRLARAALVTLTALVTLGALTAVPLDAQPATGAEAPPRYQISVLTGDAVFERFGHNALRVRDFLTGADLAYNWGMFSFDEPRFLSRFLSGDTRYWVEAFPTSWLLEVYAAQDRESIEQVLALTPGEAATLAEAVAANATPEQRFYRYDYFRDNCSTRVRDALDAALGGALARRFQAITTEWTYRSEAVRLATPDRWAQAGIDVALGPRADRAMTAWEAMYVPMRMRDLLREVRRPDSTGVAVPLVRLERTLYTARRAPEARAAQGLALGPMGPLVAVWFLLLVPVSGAARRTRRGAAAIAVGLWCTVTGLIGLMLLGMWLGSAHVFWYRNLTLLLASPVALALAWPAARGVWRGVAGRWVRAGTLALVTQTGLALALAPIAGQRLAGPLMLFAAANLAMALVVWRHAVAPPARS